jgi:cobyrinic acid a,c-diamide synthase
LIGLGLQSVELSCGTLRGHAFHHSLLATDAAPVAHAYSAGGPSSEAVYQVGSLLASYVHALSSKPGRLCGFSPETANLYGRA